LRNGQITELQLVNNVGKSMGAFSKSMNMSAQLGVYNDFAIDYAQTQQLAMFAQKDLTEQQRLAEEELKKQGGKGGKAADALVQQQTELRIQQQKANEVTERFVKAGIGPATDAMIVLAKATTAGTESLNKLFGINQPTKGPTEADKAAKAASEAARSAEKTAQAVVADKKTTREQKVSASQEAWKAQQAERNAAQGMPVPKAPKEKTSAPAPAAPASAAPTKAAPTKAAPTKAASTSAPSSTLSSNTRSASPVTQTPGLAAGEPDGVPPVKVPSGNGSLKLGPDADVSGVMPEMMSRLEQFAQLSGKSVNLNSAYRSDQKQAELWVRGNILNEPGIHMPAAPKDDQEITYKGKTYQVKGSGKGSLHGVGNAVDISVAGMGKSKGPMDDLLANAGLFRPFIQKDHPHVQMMAEGGIVQPTPGGTPAIIGEGGRAEAVIPLKNGSVPVSLNMAESLAGLSDNIAEQLKEIKDQSTTENDTALQQVTSEFKSAMAQMSQQLAGLAQTQNTDSMSGVVALLQDLVSATKNGVDVQQKILASNY
jgi:flagellar hook-basal body complex protein FliE